MKIQLSRDGIVINIDKIDLEDQTLFFGDYVEGSVQFLAYLNDGKAPLDLIANKNFCLILDHLKQMYPNQFIDKSWLSQQFVACVFSIKKKELFICGDCDAILGVDDKISEDGVKKIFLKPCERCLEDERNAAFEEGRSEENYDYFNVKDFI